ncbi:protein of unknown function DUF82 [Desulfovibrio sp. X2]|uniref:Mut7-C RNAse domain-containing protein n=1 Tax=Desulfovibrio sp. X2 TaxID=941449 RepID=UPI000358755D|nr:Mut7-C RNAse domain-containing protein [Desulfovibrio sp. X2]EPR44042.1 protein of unknown function DUF82 [Desulfovibrio sp. X2]
MHALLRFHGDLPDLLRRPHERGEVRYPADRAASLKDVVEACGIPHTEVDSLAEDGRAADFATPLRAGTAVDVRPPVPPLDPTAPHPLREPLPSLRFLADANVGRLATWLRLLGLDTAYDNVSEDAEVAERAAREGRVLLTRDRRLLRRRIVAHGRLLRTGDPARQLGEVLTLYGLRGPFAPFSRCLRCNTPLRPVAKAEVLPRLLPKTRRYYEEFHICPSCDRIYWAGSHHDGMLRMLRELGVPLPGA